MLQISAPLCQGVTTIYKIATEEPRWGAVFLATSWLLPMFRADFPGFTSKSVEYSRYLLAGAQRGRKLLWSLLRNPGFITSHS